MKFHKLVPVLCLVTVSSAQADFFSSLLSDAQSIYTAVTSILAPTTASTTTSTRATSTSSSSTSTSSTSSTSSSSTTSVSNASITPTPTTTPSLTSASTSVAAASQSSSASTSGGGGVDTLPIVLGCTLGALALAALLALLFLCHRRKRRSAKSAKHRPLSPDDDEINSWRHTRPYVRSEKSPLGHTVPIAGTAATAPLMSERSTLYPDHHHQNPFVPVPPPARRTHSRAGLQDVTEYSAHPYSPDHFPPHSRPIFEPAQHDRDNHHAMAAGLGGATLGGLAAHARDRHVRKRSSSRGRHTDDNPRYSEAEHNTLPEAATVDRRSGSVSRANAKEPWPFMDASRRSMDGSTSRSRSLSVNHEHYMTPDQHPVESMPSSGFFNGAAAGGSTGLLAPRRTGGRSPQRKGILKNTTSQFSTSSSSSNDRTYSTHSTVSPETEMADSGPHELESAIIPPLPVQRERRDSALGTAAPMGAAAAHSNFSKSGSESPRLSMVPPPIHTSEPSYDPPHVPSRSPKRHSLDHRARYSSANEGTVELPAHFNREATVSPPLEPSAAEHDLTSPVSPINTSQPGSWSRAQAEQLGLDPNGVAAKTASQESTAVGSISPEDKSDDPSNQSSGLVSAIQKIFSSSNSAWNDQEDTTSQTLIRPDNNYHDDVDHRYRSVPQRKPAPSRSSVQSHSQYGEVDQANVDTIPGAWMEETAPLQQARHRPSGDSARSQPPQYRSRDNSLGQTSINDFAPKVPTNISSNSTRPRARSRPGYGIGSGDPFDLARVRTDSSMTGLSLANCHEPGTDASPRLHSYRISTASNPYTHQEPTLADLRRQVMAEDRERARQSWRKSQSRERKDSVGRYGNDQEFFDLVDQTTGSGRFYAESAGDQRGVAPVGWAV
ncbi:hypothetical protein LTS08_007288 [Lithohypha guttulata]|nr:hypothetical protein LTS08_007288 [Lithohypha guttulata]